MGAWAWDGIGGDDEFLQCSLWCLNNSLLFCFLAGRRVIGDTTFQISDSRQILRCTSHLPQDYLQFTPTLSSTYVLLERVYEFRLLLGRPKCFNFFLEDNYFLRPSVKPHYLRESLALKVKRTLYPTLLSMSMWITAMLSIRALGAKCGISKVAHLFSKFTFRDLISDID